MTITYKLWKKNSGLSNLEAQILLEHYSNLSHAQIICNYEKIIPNEILNNLNQALRRRINGEPIAYICQNKEFYGRNFHVTEDVLIPRPETEHLIDHILSLNTNKNLNILDLGTGSGIIAITLKLENPNYTIWATDVDNKALDIAKLNAKNLNTDINFALGDWFCTTPKLQKKFFDIIVSNPPYIDINDQHLSQLQFEPQIALTDFGNGLTHIQHIFQEAKNYLKNSASIWVEHGYNQAEEITKTLQKNNYQNIKTIKDYANLNRITGGFI